MSEHQAGIFDRSFTEHLFLEFALGGGHSVDAVRDALRRALAIALAVAQNYAEATALAVKAGADPKLLGDVVAVSSGQSAQIDDRLRKHILPRNFTPGMTTELATKDSVLCLELARELGVPTFIASAAHHVYEMGVAKGYGEEEYAALIKLWEEWLSIEVRGN